MQRAMQSDAAVFRTGETAGPGRGQAARRACRGATSVTDRGLIWNTDLVETLELDNLDRPGPGDHHRERRQPQGKPRRPRARGLPRPRRRELDEAHPGLEDEKGDGVMIDYRPVHEYTMSTDIEYIKPKARVY
jgi:succinate dehydrogenase / fumarate reductase, flavoprotein subunit